ncbi:MAG: Pyruvate synthase subunit PorC [Syntrophaceae bacterium PtaB.Bin038]|nr:MAG: Pyruvate synthase subunit PorC [Syntrophaceae bacterium PtaB.Bin038]
MKEIIWFGRGGQGAVVAAQILAESAYLEGFKGVTSAPTFGPERRGAPVTASTRISEEPIRMFSQVEMADIAVVLDETLLGVVDVKGRIRKGGLVIINTACKPEDAIGNGDFDVATVDATGIALKLRLTREGAPLINTPMLGAFAKATGIVSLANVEKALRSKLPPAAAAQNFDTVRAAYEGTVVARKAQGRGLKAEGGQGTA